jgi:heterodisulfide reductase subunit C2
MQYVTKNSKAVNDVTFAQKVKKTGQVNISPCYQCLTCTLGCPVAFAMDYRPNQLIRMIQLGLKEPVLSSSAIWLCANCETCVTRCPNEVDISKLMDTLRKMSLDEGLASQKSITSFNQSFLESVRRWGKQFEVPMLLQFKLMTGDLFSDMDLGIKMLLKGKLKLTPPHFNNSTAIKAIFKKSESPSE